MKKSPDMQRLEQLLRGSKISGGGFLGTDERGIEEIIEADAATVVGLGKNCEQVAARMTEFTQLAASAIGGWMRIDDKEISIDEVKGSIVCPWPHPGKFAKRITILKNCNTGEEISWSDLNIHLISEHGFFEGKGAAFRLEPEKLVKILW